MSDEEKGGLILGALFIAVFLVVFVGTFIWYGKARESCLEMGYDQYRVTWNFRVFCVGYDGVLHPVVKEAK